VRVPLELFSSGARTLTPLAAQQMFGYIPSEISQPGSNLIEVKNEAEATKSQMQVNGEKKTENDAAAKSQVRRQVTV